MNNVIQNINIKDIVPNNNHHQYSNVEIEKLVSSIKKHGILEPITVRPKENKYELILGNKRYEAAIIAGLKTIPAIIKNIDDNEVKEYFSIEGDSLILNTPSILKSNQKNLDVINLSRLNEDYERNELKMNNNQFNNNSNQIINNEPTFGGRFFPSLEDEPTNMSFVSNNEIPTTSQNQPNNSFIDLTDLNVGNISSQILQNNFGAQTTNDINQNFNNEVPNLNQNMIPNFENQVVNSMPSIDNNNVINLDNLKQDSIMQTQPITHEMNIDNNFQEVMSDFHPNGNIVPNQFEQNPMANINMATENIQTSPVMDPLMNQTYNMVQEPVQQTMEMPQNNFQEPIQSSYNPITLDSNQLINNIEPIISEPIIDQQIQPVVEQTITQQEIVEQPIQPMMEQITPQQEIVEQSMSQVEKQKDILPVINTLKALAINLETFGYTIRITDEDLQNSYKITIEVDK